MYRIHKRNPKKDDAVLVLARTEHRLKRARGIPAWDPEQRETVRR